MSPSYLKEVTVVVSQDPYFKKHNGNGTENGNGIFSFFKHLSQLLQPWLNLLNVRTNCPGD